MIKDSQVIIAEVMISTITEIWSFDMKKRRRPFVLLAIIILIVLFAYKPLKFYKNGAKQDIINNLYYLTKPEYQLVVREEIYLDNMLDLF